MADAVRPDWLTELIGIVGLLCPPAGRASSVSSRDSKKIGQAAPDQEHGPGWFWVGLAGQTVDSDQLERGCLAPADGPDQHRFQLIESMQDGNILRVRVAEHAPTHGLCLWIPGRSPGLLEKSLLDGLSSIDRFDLVKRFADGHTDPVPPGPGSMQDKARAVCHAPGVHLVWGPPGTGKTTVIVLALQDIIASGKSVLLVSGTNIAVDNALARAATVIRPQPGVMIRAGAPHLPEVAENPAICLQKLIQDRQQRLEQQRREVEEQIFSLRRDPDIVQLAEAEAEFDSFDQVAYQQAADRVRNTELAAAWAHELGQLRQQTEQLTAPADASRKLLSQLQSRSAQASSARRDLAFATDLQRQLDELAARLHRASEQVTKLTQERDRLTNQLGATQTRVPFGNRHLKALLRSKEAQVAAAAADLDALELMSRDPAREWANQIEFRHRRAAPHTPATLTALAQDLVRAGDEDTRHGAVLAAHHDRIASLERQLRHASTLPAPTADECELVAIAHARDLPGKLAGLPGLQQRAGRVLTQVRRLEDQHEQIISTMRKESLYVRRQIVATAQVVASTLALLRLNSELHERDYDYVIVDEVAFACVPEVLYAASRARTGVTLLGDFLQNGPIPPDQFRPDTRPQQPAIVQRWYQQDSFAIFGIRDPRSAQACQGCVTLTVQHRFGPVITRLANAAAYRGVLEVARPGQGGDGQQEIVLIDVDGLGDALAVVRRHDGGGRWWPAGALVACALARAEVSQAGTKAGILVPYRPQQELVQSLLTESDADARIEVGTSHRFQGREFDVVIFDLVEDGVQQGWVASGALNGGSWEAGGLRMFNVGVTRAKRRLYLIANGAAIERARTGPLHAIRTLQEAGQIHVVRANDILGLPAPPADDPISGEIWQALRGYATLIDLFDEDHLPDELCRRIDEARYRIWLWSPWVGKRSEQLLPHLLQARDRGVTVHAVVLPKSEVNKYLQSRHEELSTQIPDTIYLGKEHQKLIIIDHHLTFIGSMNVLAHVPGGRHEVMALFRSKTLTERILEHERIDELIRPPTCQQCHAPVRHIRDRQRRLTWVCTADMCSWTRPFSDNPKGRNRPRR
jgi:AAA domain/PLD-like domain